MMEQMWTVWCDQKPCTKFDQVSGSKRSAAREFKKSGWIHKHKIGWMCQSCQVLYGFRK